MSEGYYVIYVKKGEPALLQALNEAIIATIRSGELEGIYRKYGIWDSAQGQLASIAETSRFYGYYRTTQPAAAPGQTPSQPVVTSGAPERGWNVVRNYGGVLLQSAGMTVVLSVLSFPLAIAMGLLVAIGRLYGPRWVKAPLGAYVEFLRGTPLMLQLYFIFFFLPEAGIARACILDRDPGAGASTTRRTKVRSIAPGLQAVPRGQMEAALSLGMTRAMSVRRIIAPQAVRMVIPPVVSDFIALYKDTSVCSVITIVELTKRFSVLSMSTQATVELMLMTCVLYMLMSYPGRRAQPAPGKAAGRRRARCCRESHDHDRQSRQTIRRHRGAQGHLAGRRRKGASGGNHRPFRRRQEHLPALHQRPGDISGRQHQGRRSGADAGNRPAA